MFLSQVSAQLQIPDAAVGSWALEIQGFGSPRLSSSALRGPPLLSRPTHRPKTPVNRPFHLWRLILLPFISLLPPPLFYSLIISLFSHSSLPQPSPPAPPPCSRFPSMWSSACAWGSRAIYTRIASTSTLAVTRTQALSSRITVSGCQNDVFLVTFSEKRNFLWVWVAVIVTLFSCYFLLKRYFLCDEWLSK